MQDIKQHLPAYKTVSLSPFINNKTTLRACILIAVVLVPQILMLFLTKSFLNLILIFSCLLATALSHFALLKNKKALKLNVCIIFIQGVLTGFFLPADFNPYTAFFVTLIFSCIVEYGFGGFSKSWLNPVVISVAACWFISSIPFPAFMVSSDFMVSKNASLGLIQSGIFPTFAFDEKITGFLNETVFNLFHVQIPQGYISMLWDTASVIPAFRFNLLTMLGSIVLFSADIADHVIPFIFLGVYCVLVKLFCPFLCGGLFFQGDTILALFSSGTLFAAFFVMQWFGTVPVTFKGKVSYGIAAGIVGFVLIGCGTSPVGAIMTVLFMNIFSSVLTYFENINAKMKLINAMRNENA